MSAFFGVVGARSPPRIGPTVPTVRIPGREAPLLADVDVVVAGGGPAGLAAAVAAARDGASTVLCERYGFLGGNLTVASVGTICGLYRTDGPGEFTPVVGGLAREVTDRLAAAGAGLGPLPFKETAVFVYTPWAAKRLADDLVASEENLDVLLHALVSDVVTGDDGLVAVVVATKRGPQAVRGRVFVDCTGDADLAAHAGLPTALGPAGARQHASMQFTMQNVDVDAAVAAMPRFADLVAEHGGHLTRDSGAVIPTLRPGEVLGAMTRIANPDGSPIDSTDVRQATAGEIEGRRRAVEAAAFLRDHMPGFADAFLSDTATALGIRESRRVEGRYVLTGADVRRGARFPDAVAAGAWPLEYHVRGRSTEYRFLAPGVHYEVPYRSLQPQGAANLLVAGRCVSADHDALASLRVMGPSFSVGEAAGLAASQAARAGAPVAEIDVEELRVTLASRGALPD